MTKKVIIAALLFFLFLFITCYAALGATTVSLKVNQTADDGYQAADESSFDTLGVLVGLDASATAASRQFGLFRFVNVSVPQGSLIDSAYISLYVDNTAADSPYVYIYAEKVNNSKNLVDNATIVNRAITTNSSNITRNDVGQGWFTSSNLSTLIREVTGMATWVNGNNLSIIIKGMSNGTKPFDVIAVDDATDVQARLNITWSPSNTAPSTGTISINSSSGTNKTDTNLTCWFTPTDPEAQSMVVNGTWYRNNVSVLNFTNSSVASGATAYFALDSSYTSKADVFICSARVCDSGSLCSSYTNSSSLTILNTIPSTSTPTLNNTAPYTSDVIRCDNSSSSDADNDAVSYLYRWFDSGSLIAGQTAQTLSLTTTGLNKDDTVLCEITPNDGEASGSPINSSSATILNSAPTTSAPSLNTTTPSTNDVLNCVNASWTDADGDSGTWYYRWFDSGSLIAGQTAQTLSLTTSGLNKDDTVLCEVRISDGTINSTAYNASSAATIQNSVPTTSTPTINNTAPYTNEVLLALNASVSDSDGDSVTWYYRWFDSGSLIAGQTAQTLSLTTSGLDKGNEIIVEIRAGDGDGNSTPYNSTGVTILNSAPIISGSVVINDTSPLDADDLLCNNASTSYVDADSDVFTYYWDWLRNGTSMSINNNVLGDGNTSIADTWSCRHWVSDSVVNSSNLTSASVNVGTGFVSPIIGFTNATSITTGVASSASYPTNNNSYVNLSVNFTDGNTGELFTAYFCMNDSASSSGCVGAQWCRSNSTSTLLSCSVLANLTSQSYDYYVFVADNNSMLSSSVAGNFSINHPPTHPSITFPVNNSWINKNWSLINFSSSDADSDSFNYTLWCDNSSTPTTQVYNNVSASYNLSSLNESTYYCVVKAIDQHGYASSNSSTTLFKVDFTAPVINSTSVNPASFSTGQTTLISMSCSDSGSGVNNATAVYSLTRPDAVTTTESLTLSGGSFVDTYFPIGTTGIYPIHYFYCSDLAGNSLNQTSSLSFSTTTGSQVVVGGGGSSDDDLIYERQTNKNITNTSSTGKVCGNSVCDSGEWWFNCEEDCSPTIDKLVACFDSSTSPNCIFSENWFVYLVLVMVVGVPFVYVLQDDKKKKKNRGGWI